MYLGPILNPDLLHALASMGGGDLMIVCDAGYPIPSDAWRIDLALVQDVPDLQTVLRAIAGAFVAERVGYAAEMAENNPPLLQKVHALFPKSSYETVPHATILTEMAARAKVIVRTGAFDPWGNILLYSGMNGPLWFDKPGVTTPSVYQPILDRLRGK